MKKLLSVICCVCLLFSLVSGCAGGEEGVDSDTPLELTVRAISAQATADPAATTGSDSDTLILHLYENLLKWEDDGSGHAVAVEGIAQSYTTQEQTDGSVVYTFTLRSDARWSDGEPVTAGDFVYAWQRLFSMENPPAALARAKMVAGYSEAMAAKDGTLLTGVAAPNDSTLVITLTSPCGYFLDVFCAGALTMPVRQDLAERYGDRFGTAAEQVVTNGPYTLAALDSTGARLTRSETYYDQVSPGPATINFVWSDGDSAADYAALTAGEADFADQLTQADAAALAEAGELTVDPLPSTYALLLNTAAECFSSDFVRDAFSLVIDRQALTEATGSLTLSPATGFVPHGITNRDDQWAADSASETEATDPDGLVEAANSQEDEEAVTYWDFRAVGDAAAAEAEAAEDPAAQARELMSQAGYPNGANFPDTEFIYLDTAENQAAAEYIRDTLRDSLGVTITLTPCAEEDLRSRMLSGEYTMAAFRFDAGYDDATAFLNRWRSTVSVGAGNLVQHADQAYDLLLYVVDITASLSAREACLHDAEELLLQSNCVIPLFYYGSASQLADGLTGLYRGAMGNYFFSGVTRG